MIWNTASRSHWTQRRNTGPSPSPSSEMPRRCCRNCCAAASRSTSSPTRPARMTHWPISRAASPSRNGMPTQRPSPRSSPIGRVPRWPPTWKRWWHSRTPGPRSSTTATPSAARRSSPDTSGPSISLDSFLRTSDRLFCEGRGPFRWVALSGDPADIHATDDAVRRLFPDNDSLQRWMRLAPERIAFQGLPARICWLGAGERDKAGLEFNSMVASGKLSAPVVIGRDHLDAGSVASPFRETEAMADGSDAIADWPLLNALVSTASGRDLGVDPPRRRRRHRSIDPCRPGHGRRRHGARRGQGGAGPDKRPGDGRPAACRRRVPRGGQCRRCQPSDDSDGAGRGGHRRRSPGGTDFEERCMRFGASAADGSRFASAWSDLAGVGRDHVRGGYSRHAFDDAEMQLRQWFTEQAERRGLDVETDRNGNLWAWWGAAGHRARWSPVRTWTRCPAAAPSTARWGWSPALLAVDELRLRGRHPGSTVGRRLLRRGGGRPIRSALHGVPADDRCRRCRPGPPAARRRRRVGGRRRPQGRDRPGGDGPRPGSAGRHRHLRRTACRAGQAAADRRRGGRRRRRLGDRGARPVADHRHRPGQPRRHHAARRIARTR